MSSSRLLDFFVLEATDYVDRLDLLLADSAGGAIDADALASQSRLLRGSATMARLSGIADLATAVERIGRALRDKAVEWDEPLRAAVTAAVDDLRILVRGARSWGEGDSRRAQARVDELTVLCPQASASATPTGGMRNSSFIASETTQLATALDAVIARPTATDAVAVALHRARSLRGVAALKDLPPLPELLEELEALLVSLSGRQEMPSTAQLTLLGASMRALRRASQEIATAGKPDPQSAPMREMEDALGAMRDERQASEPVVPISQLAYDDEQAQMLSGPGGATASPEDRFRLEIVSRCEHLLHNVDRASSGSTAALRDVLASARAVRDVAASFNQSVLVSALDSLPGSAGASELSLLRELGTIYSSAELDQAAASDKLEAALRDYRLASSAVAALDDRIQVADSAAALSTPDGVPSVAAPSPVATPAPTARAEQAQHAPAEQPGATRARSVSGKQLSTLLEQGLSGLAGLEEQPLSQPAALEEDNIVPVESLLYRGADALTRARELRDSIVVRDGVPKADEVAELFELLDLAATE